MLNLHLSPLRDSDHNQLQTRPASQISLIIFDSFFILLPNTETNINLLRNRRLQSDRRQNMNLEFKRGLAILGSERLNGRYYSTIFFMFIHQFFSIVCGVAGYS